MRRFLIVISGVLLFLLYQCKTGKDPSGSYFDGEWQAQWLLLDDEIRQMFSEADITMNGRVVFHDGEHVEITAFGFEGCVFASDTARNTLTYEFQDSLLNLMNSAQEVVFSYTVRERLPDQLTLVLMDDILLTLHR